MLIFYKGDPYSHFSRQVVKLLSGQPIETIDNPSLLVNAILNITMDSYEKISLSPTMGFNPIEAYTNLGAYIEYNSLITTTQSYSVPLIGCLNTAKFIPALISDIEIDLTVNNIANFISNVVGTVGTSITSILIRNVEIVCDAVTL